MTGPTAGDLRADLRAAAPTAVPPADIWRLLVVHRTVLTYPDTVTTSYNEVRMQPADEPGQAVLSARLELDPFEGVLGFHDYFGTRVAAFDVHRPHRQLVVTATSTVETFPPTPAAPSWSWAELERSGVDDRFEEFLTPTPLTQLDDELTGIAAELRAAAADPRAAGLAVCDFVNRTLTYEAGVTGVSTSALEAWTARRGVCQDLSHLAIGLLRSMGVPTRYVSGYLHPDRTADIGRAVTGESHAWVEWFDGTWFRFDPTNGHEPAQAHVVVGRGRDYGDVPPVKGVYAGPDAIGNQVTVRVTRLR
ncbi:transglutaminase family protein [Nakamurella leprariae]|uniref:Transglutaminase family protein n=1 Tax=Nakamurella leprariae TaxID=2803911 RepID=A0A938YDH3_9ACTN|nr:transglutaminase family protein [Nakamurella leprariae]MBM9468677.1 transglutaminase family protein [Nakamurella leprariae]